MASIAQLVSEMAHSLIQPNNVALRINLALLFIKHKNKAFNRVYENQGPGEKF